MATVEAGIREIRHDVEAVLDLLNGGDNVTWERSVRGRLHSIESTLAGMVLRRNMGVGFAKGWVQAAIVLAAVATALAAWWAALGL